MITSTLPKINIVGHSDSIKVNKNLPVKERSYFDTVSFSGKSKDLKSQAMSPKDFQIAVDEKVANVTAQNKAQTVSELTEVLDLYLQNKWNDKTQPGKKEIVIKSLKNIVGGQGNIALAQINTTPADIEGNAKIIMSYIKTAEAIGLGTVIFPDQTLMGAPVYEMLGRYPYVVKENQKWLDEIAKRTGKTKVVVGFVEQGKQNESGESVLFNSLAVLQNGKIQKIVQKTPVNDSQSSKPIELDGMLIDTASSDSRHGEEPGKHQRLSSIAKQKSMPYVYVNQVGTIDGKSFDGASRVYDSNGSLIARSKSFSEQFQIVNPTKSEGTIHPLPKGSDRIIKAQNEFSLNYEDDLERTYQSAVQSIRDYFNKNGLKRAVLGLSGGLDSAVNAVLLVDALGADNVYGFSLPSKITSEDSNVEAKELAQNLGMHYDIAPITDMVGAGEKTTQKLFDKIGVHWAKPTWETTTADNIQARVRATILFQVSNEFPGVIPIATSDKSELYIGYATINGDMSGGFAPTADIVKTKSRALARWMNLNRDVKNVIPENTIVKPSGAELANNEKTGKTVTADEVNGPESFRDEIIWRIENFKQSAQEMVNEEFLFEKMARGDFKPQNIYEEDALSQVKTFVRQTYGQETYSLNKEQKQIWLNRFFNNMAKSAFKATIMPPGTLIEPKTINHSDYKQPITSGMIGWKQETPEQIGKKLDMVI